MKIINFIKNKLIDKDGVFLISQPKHKTSSIVVVGNEFPLSLDKHENIDRLSEVSDIIFVFSSNSFNNHLSIDKDKFTSLYNGCGWVDYNEFISESVMKVLYYDREIFNDHLGFIITSTWNLSNYVFNPKEYLRILGSSLQLPILSIKRRDNIELFETYSKLSIFSRNEYDKFFKYKSQSNILFFRKPIVDLFLNHWTENEDYFKTFTDIDCNNMFASLIKYLNLSNIDKTLGMEELPV